MEIGQNLTHTHVEKILKTFKRKIGKKIMKIFGIQFKGIHNVQLLTVSVRKDKVTIMPVG